MAPTAKPITILMADDDPDDRQLTKEAFEESHLANDLRFVEDGEELMDYLHRRGRYADPASSPRPAILLLDLNMPRKDGREALKEIKADPALRHIPIIAVTSYALSGDEAKTRAAGCDGYVAKPFSPRQLLAKVREFLP